MESEAFIERRQWPRVMVSGDLNTERPMAISVRVLDIGLTGVLLASSHPFEVGQHARISTRLGASAIEADVVVRRVSPSQGDKGGYKIGARFVSLDEATRQAMKQFFTSGNNR